MTRVTEPTVPTADEIAAVIAEAEAIVLEAESADGDPVAWEAPQDPARSGIPIATACLPRPGADRGRDRRRTRAALPADGRRTDVFPWARSPPQQRTA